MPRWNRHVGDGAVRARFHGRCTTGRARVTDRRLHLCRHPGPMRYGPNLIHPGPTTRMIRTCVPDRFLDTCGLAIGAGSLLNSVWRLPVPVVSTCS